MTRESKNLRILLEYRQTQYQEYDYSINVSNQRDLIVSEPFNFWYPVCARSIFTKFNGFGVFQLTQTVEASITNPGKFVLNLKPDTDLDCIRTVSAYVIGYTSNSTPELVNPTLPTGEQYDLVLTDPQKVQSFSFQVKTVDTAGNLTYFIYDTLTLNVICPYVKLGAFQQSQTQFSTLTGQMFFNLNVQEVALQDCGSKFIPLETQDAYQQINIFDLSIQQSSTRFQLPILDSSKVQYGRFFIQALGINKNTQNEIFSIEFEINVICGPNSTELNSPVLLNNKVNEDYREMNPPSDVYKILNFGTTNVHCPISLLQIIMIPYNESAQEKLNSTSEQLQIISNFTGEEIWVKMPDYSTLTKKYAFMIKGTAYGGATKLTEVIFIKLRNCNNQQPQIVGNGTIQVDTFPTSISVKSIFNSSEPSECPVNDYRISRIIDNRTQVELQNINNICEINTFGSLSIIIEKLPNDYLIYVQASHGFSKIFSKELQVILKKPINHKPYFVSQIKEQEYTIDYVNQTFSYEIPKYVDPENTAVSLRFIYGLKQFMKFDSITNTLQMRPNTAGEHQLKLRIDDEDGEYEEDQLIVRFKYAPIAEKEIKIIKVEIQNDTKAEEETIKQGALKNDQDLQLNENFNKLLNKFLEEKSKIQNQTINVKEEQNMQPVQIKFSNFNYEGILKITFNQKLKQFDGYLENRALQIQKFDKKELAQRIFDFKLLRNGLQSKSLIDNIEVPSWDHLGLEVKFNFFQPLNISTEGSPDQIQGSVKKESFAFFIAEESSFILEEVLTMSIEVPSQLPEGITQQAVEDVAESANNAVLAIIIIQLIGQFILKSGMKNMVTLFFIIQFVIAMEDFEFHKTAVLQIAFDQIKTFIGFKYLNINWFLGVIEPNLSLQTLFLSQKKRFEINITQTDQTDVLITSLGMALLSFVIFAIFISLLAFTKLGRNQAKKLIQTQKDNLIWNGIIMMSYVNFINITKKSRNQIESGSLTQGLLQSFVLLGYVIFMGMYLVLNYKNLDLPSFRIKYENFYKEVAIKNRAQRSVFFYPAFLIKRWLIVLTIVVMGQDSGLQFFALLNINCIMVIFYGWINPHDNRQRMWQEYFNEVMIMLLSYQMLCMTSFLIDREVIQKVGYAFTGQFGILVVGNLVYIFNVIFTKFLRVRKLNALQQKFIEFYEIQFKNLEKWQKQHLIAKEEMRKKVKKSLIETRFINREILEERAESVRLSSINEDEEIDYQNSTEQSQKLNNNEVKESSYIIHDNSESFSSNELVPVQVKQHSILKKRENYVVTQEEEAVNDAYEITDGLISKEELNVLLKGQEETKEVESIDKIIKKYELKTHVVINESHVKYQSLIKQEQQNINLNRLEPPPQEKKQENFNRKTSQVLFIDKQTTKQPMTGLDVIIRQIEVFKEEKKINIAKQPQGNLIKTQDANDYPKDIEGNKLLNLEIFTSQYTLESNAFIYDHRFIKSKDYKVIQLGDGAVYRGQVDATGRYNGYGVMISQDQSVYEGQWHQGKKNGEGYFRNARKGLKYEGSFEKDKPHGLGKEMYLDNTTYHGNFEKGKYHGRGSFKSEQEEYTGEYMSGIKHGYGRFKNLLTGETYVGNYYFGIKQGLGTHILANCEKFEGTFKTGIMHGRGSWWKDHRKYNSLNYKGLWEAGIWNGNGILEYDKNSYYKGNFKDHKKHGKGIMFTDNGQSFYQGEFINDRKDGMGRLAIKGELVYDGQWKNDKQVLK